MTALLSVVQGSVINALVAHPNERRLVVHTRNNKLQMVDMRVSVPTRQLFIPFLHLYTALDANLIYPSKPCVRYCTLSIPWNSCRHNITCCDLFYLRTIFEVSEFEI